MDWMVLLKVFVTLLALAGALAIVLGLPGTFLAWLGLLIYALVDRFTAISAWVLLGTFVGSLVIELVDNLMAGFLVKRFGASKGSVLMAWLGGFGGAMLGGTIGSFGGFLGSALIGILGAFAGSYAAVYLWERNRHNRTHNEAVKAALGTVVGRLLGMLVKLGWIGWIVSLVW
ncbi:MAG: DUF456 domain-containing protein [Armatimonadetes bacterium]|nr:DUF456 domain-containing protein [Armatimonadota bacterium]MCX7967722.1 DUF456 domain-containing protein [Armatimonadota bacterium]MDW8142758.1 DUF456 domain-containing protein [Armatimonadota bacterium]